MSKEAFKLVSDVMCQMSLGRRLREEDGELEKLKSLMTESSRLVKKMFVAVVFRRRWIGRLLTFKRQIMFVSAKFDEFLERIFEEYQAEPNKDQKSEILDAFLQASGDKNTELKVTWNNIKSFYANHALANFTFFSCLSLLLRHVLLPSLSMSYRDKESSSSLAAMNEYSETVRNKIQALVHVIKVARAYREDNVPSLIQEGLYLGSVAAACNKNLLKSYNVTHILTVASSLRPAHPDDFIYKVVRGRHKLGMYFDECFDFIDEAKKLGGSVLVHCFVGKSRSVTIVVAYLMKKHGMTLTQALQHVKSIRPVASPNAGFIKQLQDLEKSLLGNQEPIAQCQA
ncbi:Cytochrome P450 protein [Raphanus sativus]|nr:Cytochrome P450 protein [Raphanus sativus]